MKCACNFIDLTGQKFGRLTIVDRMTNNKHGEEYNEISKRL